MELKTIKADMRTGKGIGDTTTIHALPGVWPQVEVGEHVIVENRGYLWPVEVLSSSSADNYETIVARLLGERVAAPMPAIADGKLALPFVGGHAHTRSWRRGDVVEVRGEFWRVTKATRTSSGRSVVYMVTHSDAARYARRPWRMDITPRQTRFLVGSCVELPSGEWGHVKRVTTKKGWGASGPFTTHIAHGRLVSEVVAARRNSVHWHHLHRALIIARDRFDGTRFIISMPEDSTVLAVAADGGSRVAVVNPALVLFESGVRGWRSVVDISNRALVKRVKAFIAAARR